MKKFVGSYFDNETKRHTYQRVGVEEDTLGELRESPAVQFREGHTKVGASEQGQVRRVLAVKDVHMLDVVEHVPQLFPGGRDGNRVSEILKHYT